jgi:hypothetical protein
MESQMQPALEISLAPERLDEGTPEERAAFGLFTIRTSSAALTEGHDFFIDAYRPGPLVSGYHVAEWLAWNWWRLRWESRSSAVDWLEAHCMTSIGEGYLWPNITIVSDGVRTTVLSAPSSRPDAKPFRYFGSRPLILPSVQFEAAVDEFMQSVIGRLRAQSVPETNLDRVWRDVLAERRDAVLAKRRRLEALMGREPDGADDADIAKLIEEAKYLGEMAVDEVAAEAAKTGNILTMETLRGLAAQSGVEASPSDVVQLAGHRLDQEAGTVPAWQIGANAARALRLQEQLGSAAISNKRLASMVGCSPKALTNDAKGLKIGSSPISFMLDSDEAHARVVFDSPRESRKRFDLARLLGDRLMADAGALHPATRAYTFRQKAQRSFAAELLAPFTDVEDMLNGDYSIESQQDVAEYFSVSEWTISTLLKSYGRIPRDDFDFEMASQAA